MIPLSRVLAEIDKHASAAKLRGDDQSIRDSLLAIRALCDVALSEQVEFRSVAAPIRVEQPSSTIPSVSSGERMKEDGANGDSLFDF
ncbi:YwdI family protein [Paenisporosarcina indica]|uniref:YwdI family protein n=1 Tax=Paenisporosarcina indica TaxID=650093 RepID=UPI0009500C77|nr:YwdI family protein [Paenisporosarcina indica]